MWNCFKKRRRLLWKRKWDLLHNAGNLAPLCLIRICRLTRMSYQDTISYNILAKYLVTAKSRWTNQLNDLTIARIITTYGHLPVFSCQNFIPHVYLVYLHWVYTIDRCLSSRNLSRYWGAGSLRRRVPSSLGRGLACIMCSHCRRRTGCTQHTSTYPGATGLFAAPSGERHSLCFKIK